MLNITKCVLASLFVCHLVQAADGPFELRSVDEARMKAKEEGKLVFIDFYTTWCGPCKIMEKTTFADVEVVEWLKENTIALKVDAEKNVELANAYTINAYPTLIFTNADGTELGRMIGVQDPKPFLAEAAAIKAGKTPLVRAKEKLVAAGENDPMARMGYARNLVEMGKYEEALADFLWCFDQGNKHSIGFVGVRISFLLSDIVRLGDKYPPALDALRQRRDATRKRIRQQKPKKRFFWQIFSTGADYSVLDFSSLNECLGEEGETLKLYDEMRAEHPDWPVVEQLRNQVFDELLKAKRYTEIAESRDIDRWIEQKAAMEKLDGVFLSKENRQMIERLRRESLMREIGEYYEVLVGAKNVDAADKLAQYALKMDDGAETYNLLAWHGYMTGSPTKANLVQARKAYNLTKGQNTAIIDTLVRILDITDNKDEACDLLRTSVSDSFSEPDRKILAKCVADLNCPESK